MAKYKQGYADRMDERLGMKDGPARMKKQNYKDRRDESYGMKNMGVMGHDKKPMKCDPFAAQKKDMGRVQREPMNNRGYPKQAFDYKY
jgi:hypothetical protein